jgi:protein TonB
LLLTGTKHTAKYDGKSDDERPGQVAAARRLRTGRTAELNEMGMALPAAAPGRVRAAAARPAARPIFMASLALSIAVHAALLRWMPGASIASAAPPPVLDVTLVEAHVPPLRRHAVPTPPHAERPAHRYAPVPRATHGAPASRQLAAKAQRSAPPLLAVPRPAPVEAQASVAVAAAPAPALVPPSPQVDAPVIARAAQAMVAPAPPPAAATPPSFDAAYLDNPAPRYPLIARRNGDEGTVTLRVLVSHEGRARNVALERTSGYPALDAAALDAVTHWRFVPARRAGEPVDAYVIVPIVFRLHDAG